jgi:hypothetical protein
MGGLEYVGKQFDYKGEKAKASVDSAYNQAREILIDRLRAKGGRNLDQSVASIDAAIAAGKARDKRKIDSLVRKAKANATTKFLGGKVPDDATSSYDIEAAVPTRDMILRELSPK